MKNYWPIIRTLTFLIVGVFNTFLIRPEDSESWKNYLGYFLLALVVFEIASYFIKKIRRVKHVAFDKVGNRIF